jgi:hypothetical protein
VGREIKYIINNLGKGSRSPKGVSCRRSGEISCGTVVYSAKRKDISDGCSAA